jgi:hypothetical protein
MNRETERRIRENLFEAAWPALEPWDEFPWHEDRFGNIQAHKPNSSQALAIDVFGTIKTSPCRDRIMGRIAERLGVSPAGPWEISLEWCSPQNELREKRRTQVDAIAESPGSLVFFECKFTEAGGSCSQTEPLKSGMHRGLVQCDGSYRLQTNPANGVSSRCALTGKGIDYWDVIPQIFPFPAERDSLPCPFALSCFQWMRNLALCFARGRTLLKRPAVVAAYADHPKLAMARTIEGAEWRRFAGSVRREAVAFSSISYQQMVRMAEAAVADRQDEAAKWRKLRSWVERKISTAGELADAVQTRD